MFLTLFVVRKITPSKYSRIRKNTHTMRSLKAHCSRCSTKISASSSRRVAFQWLASLNILTRVCSLRRPIVGMVHLSACLQQPPYIVCRRQWTRLNSARGKSKKYYCSSCRLEPSISAAELCCSSLPALDSVTSGSLFLPR